MTLLISSNNIKATFAGKMFLQIKANSMFSIVEIFFSKTCRTVTYYKGAREREREREKEEPSDNWHRLVISISNLSSILCSLNNSNNKEVSFPMSTSKHGILDLSFSNKEMMVFFLEIHDG